MKPHFFPIIHADIPSATSYSPFNRQIQRFSMVRKPTDNFS